MCNSHEKLETIFAIKGQLFLFVIGRVMLCTSNPQNSPRCVPLNGFLVMECCIWFWNRYHDLFVLLKYFKSFDYLFLFPSAFINFTVWNCRCYVFTVVCLQIFEQLIRFCLLYSTFQSYIWQSGFLVIYQILCLASFFSFCFDL